MTESIIAILAAISGLVLWFLKRKRSVYKRAMETRKEVDQITNMGLSKMLEGGKEAFREYSKDTNTRLDNLELAIRLLGEKRKPAKRTKRSRSNGK